MKKLLSVLSIALVGMGMAKAETTQSSENEDYSIAQKWEMKASLGAMLTNYEKSAGAGLIKWGESLQFELGYGYNLNSNLFVGASTGYFYSYGCTMGVYKDNQLIPVLGDVVYRWKAWEKCSLFAEGRAGYLFNLLDSQKLGDGSMYDPSGYVLLEVMPGAYYHISENLDFRFSLGYSYGISTESGSKDLTNNESGFVLKLGVNFRNAHKKAERTALKE